MKPAAAEKLLTLAQASSMIGKAESTIRRLIDKGSIQSLRDEKGRHLIELGQLLAHFAGTTRSESNLEPATATKTGGGSVASPAVELAAASATVRELRERITLLEMVMERDQRELERLRDQNNGLQGELLKLTAELKAILTKETGNKPSNWFRR
jgi:hypothetical protein